jgi:hypothetical protein
LRKRKLYENKILYINDLGLFLDDPKRYLLNEIVYFLGNGLKDVLPVDVFSQGKSQKVIEILAKD